MPRRRLDPEETKLKRQGRNQRYRANPATKERNKEHDKLYRQNKRHHARQALPQDPLNPLLDQQQYLEAENDARNGIVDANNMMKEDGENFHDGHWNEGFPDEIGSEMNDNDVGWNEGFADEVESDMNDDGDDESDGGLGDDSVMNDDGSQIVIYY